MINARIDCSQSPLEVRLTPAEMVQLDLEDPVREAAWAKLVQSRAAAPLPDAQVYHCGGGISAFAIDPEGKLSICVLSKKDMFDLREGSFKEGWDQFLAKVRKKKTTRHTKCNDCRIRELCSTCAATAELEHGDAEAPVEFFCEVAHLRARPGFLWPPAHGVRSQQAAAVMPTSCKSWRPSRAARARPVDRRSASSKATDGRRPGSRSGSGGCGACGGARMTEAELHEETGAEEGRVP